MIVKGRKHLVNRKKIISSVLYLDIIIMVLDNKWWVAWGGGCHIMDWERQAPRPCQLPVKLDGWWLCAHMQHERDKSNTLSPAHYPAKL